MQSRRRAEADRRVIDEIKRSPDGATVLEIARAYLGHRARRTSVEALTMTGLGIAARLCGEGTVEPTRTNRFKIKQERAA